MHQCKCNVSSQRVRTLCLLTASASNTAARVVSEIQGKWIIGCSNATGNKPGSLGTGHYSSGEREHIQAANGLCATMFGRKSYKARWDRLEQHAEWHDMAGRISRASCTTKRRRVRSIRGTTGVKLQLHSTQLDFIGVNMPPRRGRG